MNRNISIFLAAIVVLSSIIAAYLYWQNTQPRPEIVRANVPPAPPMPEVHKAPDEESAQGYVRSSKN